MINNSTLLNPADCGCYACDSCDWNGCSKPNLLRIIGSQEIVAGQNVDLDGDYTPNFDLNCDWEIFPHPLPVETRIFAFLRFLNLGVFTQYAITVHIRYRTTLAEDVHQFDLTETRTTCHPSGTLNIPYLLTSMQGGGLGTSPPTTVEVEI